MISCTEFIPAYSELFKYLDERKGYPEVQKFWTYLFKPDGKGIPLINFLKKDGLKGAWDYWSGTLSEESADVTRIMNLKEGWIKGIMHYCPSKGRLLQMKDELGIEPYPHYCDHCDYYRAALEECGFSWFYDFTEVDRAACTSVIYDPKIFKGVMTMDEDTVVLEYKSKELEYFHPDFHSSMNMGIDYLGVNYGTEAVEEYLEIYTRNAYKKVIEDIKNRGLSAIADKIKDTYKLEKAEDVLTVRESETFLSVQVSACPAVSHLHKTGREVSKWFSYTTKTVMQTLAKAANCTFTMVSYEEATGAAEYCFEKL